MALRNTILASGAALAAFAATSAHAITVDGIEFEAGEIITEGAIDDIAGGPNSSIQDLIDQGAMGGITGDGTVGFIRNAMGSGTNGTANDWVAGDNGRALEFVFGGFNIANITIIGDDGDGMIDVGEDFVFDVTGPGFIDFFSGDDDGTGNIVSGTENLWLSYIMTMGTVGTGTAFDGAGGFAYQINIASLFFDVTGGLAGFNFDTDGEFTGLPGLFADLETSVQLDYECTAATLASCTLSSFDLVRGVTSTETNAIPAPASAALLGLGLLGFGVAARRRRS